MEIGTFSGPFQETCGERAFSDKRPRQCFVMMREAGFTCADLSSITDVTTPYYTSPLADALAEAKAERAAAESAGIRIHQVHAPWPTDDTSEEKRKLKLAQMERAVRLTAAFGARYLVIHPDMPYGWDSEPDPAFSRETNRAMFRALLPIAEEVGVVLCLENMPMKAHKISPATETLAFVRELNHPSLGMCLDTGHANVFGEDCGELVRAIGAHLKTLHVHDNMGDCDSHLPPFAGTVNWDDFTTALKEIGFLGVFSMETNLVRRDKSVDATAEGARSMAEIARRLADCAE